jgi:replicative DNA helicase
VKDLNPESQAIYETLVSKDEAKFDMTEDVQKLILGALLTDRIFLVQSMGLVKSGYFLELAHQHIHRILVKYFDKYKILPHKFFVIQELGKIAKENEEQRVLFLGELEAVLEYYIPGVDDHEFLLDEITAFAKEEAMRAAFKKCTDIILEAPKLRETWTKVDVLLREAMTVEKDIDIGLDYFQTVDERYNRLQDEIEHTERFTSGFESIDDALSGGGLSKGEIGAWIGIPGVGKSLALVKGTVANLNLGKKVLYISLEMDQDKVAARFDAQFARQNINKLHENKNIVVEALREIVRDYEDKRLLVIKQFPGSTVDVTQIRAYHVQLGLYGFKPDLVIVDYIGEMKDIAGMPTHESREQLIKQLRAFGVEEGHCTLTAVQPNRGAQKAQENKGYIDDQQIGDSYNQFRPLDAFWSINQSQQEKDQGIGRVFVIKHRNGQSRFPFFIGYDYGPGKCFEEGVGTLDMSEVEKDFYMTRMNEQVERDTKNTKFDQIKVSELGNIKKENVEKMFSEKRANLNTDKGD